MKLMSQLKFGQKTNEPMTELVCTSAIVQNRNL